jgi:putative endonuclease
MRGGGRKVQGLKGQSKAKGFAGEERAASWLLSQGWMIRERNFRGSRGEIDIIAEKGPRVAFVEVKAWKSLPQSELEYAVDGRKRARIEQAARYYLALHPGIRERQLSFDVIFIDVGAESIRHIEGAFPGGID